MLYYSLTKVLRNNNWNADIKLHIVIVNVNKIH